MAWKNDQVSETETKLIVRLALECLEVSGDFVELGCYKGDTSLMLAEVVQKGASFSSSGGHSETTLKRLWIYDSFEGLPEKGEKDESVLGEEFTSGALFVTKREVKERFLRAGLKVPMIKKGWFKELESSDLPEKIAFSFIDGDFYESIRDGLFLVQDKMADGSVIIVHDYNNPALPGVKTAVDEWIRITGTRDLQVLETCAIIRVNSSNRAEKE